MSALWEIKVESIQSYRKGESPTGDDVHTVKARAAGRPWRGGGPCAGHVPHGLGAQPEGRAGSGCRAQSGLWLLRGSGVSRTVGAGAR